MQQLRKELVNKCSHLFYSSVLEIPTSLSISFPHLQRLVIDAERQTLPLDETEACVLWWHLMPGVSVAQQFKTIREIAPAARVVAMSDLPNDVEALAVFSVMAKAYCNTHAGAEVLLKIAQVVDSGGLWIGESIMQRLLNLPVAKPEPPAASSVNSVWDMHLTLREREVASAISSGASNRQIADQMGITERTVKAHVGSVLEKLHLKNRLQLALLVKDR